MADVRTASPYLEQIEKSIGEIQNEQNIPQNLELIRDMINREFKAKCVSVYITNNTTVDYFFGAHVFPTEKELAKIADKVIHVGENVKFETCSEFVIELDSKLVYNLGATPREITAAILHEIGHKVYGKEAQLRAKISFMNNMGTFVGTTALILKVASPLKFLLFLAILGFFSSSLNNYLRMRNEVDADSFALKYGYGADMASLLQRMTENSKIAVCLNKKSKDDPQEDAIMRWSVKNIMNFSLRRGELIRQMKQFENSTESPYLKEVCSNQAKMAQRAKGATVKTVTEEDNAAARNESVETFIQIKRRGMSTLELDELNVEIDRIEDAEDKLYVIRRIHDDMQDCDAAIETLKNGGGFFSRLAGGLKSSYQNNELAEFQEYRKELVALLARVKGVKVKEREFSINVAYPAGDVESK